MSMRLLLFCIVLFVAACQNNDSPATGHNASVVQAPGTKQLTTIRWIDSAKNLGKINEGQKVSVSFRFRNSGENPLVIEAVQPGCGCTVADYPKEPIAAGSESEITGSFDSKGREGLQHKEIIVRANTPGSGEQTISFEVEVIKKATATTTN